MATLSLKPNARKTAPLVKPVTGSEEWVFSGSGVMNHTSGFSIQFFNKDECDIINIPEDMSLSTVRELTTKAIKARNRRSR